ncbi:MAG: hypothetical protein RJA94_233 [Pseudomonadota bacterium]|jgi:hypothetical protein
MLKLALIGIWVILVTAGATFASVYLGEAALGSSAETEDLGVEELTSELTSVPIIRGGDVSGYVIMQFSFAADRALLGDSKLDPMPYIKDAVFRVAFTNSEIDFRHLRSGDLDRLTDSIATEANRRLGAKIVRQVLFQQLNFVKKEDIRTNWIGEESGQR